jgi:hypothetical protein
MPAPAITPETQFIKVKLGNFSDNSAEEVTIDQMADEQEMRRMLVHFFKKPHGKRETYTVYRGCLIVRNTVQCGGSQVRRTAAYLFYKTPVKPGRVTQDAEVSNITGDPEPTSVKQAERLIDKVLDGGVKYYGIKWK